MSQIFSILGLPDSDQAYVNTVGQSVIYDAVQELLARHSEDLNGAISAFVQETTSDHARRYKLPGGGYMQRRGRQAPAAARKTIGKWDVAFPLEDFGDALMSDDISLAYMTLQELNRHLDGITAADYNTNRQEILTALFNNAVWSFVDEKLETPTLSVQPLANGDAVVYPPVIGSDSEATENHYKVTGYTVANISDTNDPMEDGIAELEEHFGSVTGGSEIVKFAGSTLASKLRTTLTDFEDIDDRHIQQGANANEVVGLPANLPGKLIGRHNGGMWLVQWDYIPADYDIDIHLGVARPLIRRVDPSETGLPQGLQLVAKSDKYPLENSQYRHRYGYGVGNRLNGVVHKYAASGDYSVPTTYARG